MGSRFIEFLRELIVEVRPRQASVLAYIILARTSERLFGEGACCRCYDTE